MRGKYFERFCFRSAESMGNPSLDRNTKVKLKSSRLKHITNEPVVIP